MFDRMAKDNAETARKRIAVRLTLDDGTTLAGAFVVPGQGDLQTLLNGERDFFLFVDRDGEPCLLSKTAIVDPFTVLGVERNADRDTVRAAYRAQVKAYHPDRIRALALPAEMVDYGAAMLTRINAAYEEIAGTAARVA